MREENLFYKLSNNYENAATELLCNLCKFSQYKEIIFNELKINNDLFTYQNIDTQYNIPGKRKKPDIVIENEKNKIFIENKVSKHRKLELSQLTIYPEYLNNISDKKVKLIFLIPRGYNYQENIIEAKKKYRFISIVFWDDLIEKIKIRNKIINSEILFESIAFFEKILNTIPEINFEQEEINLMLDIKTLIKDAAAIGKMLDLLYNVIYQLKDKLKLDFKKGEYPYPEVSENCLGFLFYRESCWIGYSFSILNEPKLKDYVFSFVIHESIVSKEKIKKIPQNSYAFFEEWYYFKIDKKILENINKEKIIYQFCEKVMKDVVKKIHG